MITTRRTTVMAIVQEFIHLYLSTKDIESLYATCKEMMQAPTTAIYRKRVCKILDKLICGCDHHLRYYERNSPWGDYTRQKRRYLSMREEVEKLEFGSFFLFPQ